MDILINLNNYAYFIYINMATHKEKFMECLKREKGMIGIGCIEESLLVQIF